MRFNVYEFALMARFIELGKRYGLEPWELPIDYDSETGNAYLTGTPANPETYQRLCEMVKALGIDDPDAASLFPHEEGEEMFNALDEAIKNAPPFRKWVR